MPNSLNRLIGRLVTCAEYRRDNFGEPHILIKFNDGTELFIDEGGHAGWVRVELNGERLDIPEME